MANTKTYSATCSSVGGYSYASNFKLYVKLEETNVETANNRSKVKYTVYCESSGSGSISARHLKYFKLNGQTIIDETVSVSASSPNAYISIASGTTGYITHNNDGKKSISFEAEIDASSYGVSASKSGSFALTDIPRYTSITSFTVTNISGTDGLTKLRFNWKTADTIDYVWYSTNNGSNWTGYNVADGTSGYFDVSNLSPNTSYNCKLRVRRKDSQLNTDSGTVTKSTYDIARLTSYSNFNLGDSVTVNYTNPSGAPIQVGLYKDGNTPIAPYRDCSGSSYTFNFTDEELDTMYSMINGNTLEAFFYINTNNNTWRENKNITITLTGNQKTGHKNINGSWKRTKKWININGTWKRCVRWINVNGVWKKCI